MTYQPRFTVLGPVRAWCGNLELDLGSPQQRAVLAALLLREGRQATINELIDALFGDDPPRAVSGTVRTYLYRLRRTLSAGGGPGVASAIESVGGGYALRISPGALDYSRFQELVAQAGADRQEGNLASASAALRAADALWQGPALAGVPGPHAQSCGARLEGMRRAAVEDRLAIDLDLGEHTKMVTELSTLVR
jgi:DNA-binding SARP family transcriptional activator